MTLRDKWKITVQVFLVTSVLAPIILLIISYSQSITVMDMILTFKSGTPSSFYFEKINLSTLSSIDIFVNRMIGRPLAEEGVFRGLIFLASFTLSKTRIGGRWIWIIMMPPMLGLNYLWASTHSIYPLSIFIIGVVWGWLTIKTRSLWPAVTCHILANFSIYLVIQIFQILFYPL